ncbi:MAG: hypothetical protein KatS3mg004_3210 [Bryobacteraceae bacterium]|nr:MAG: hypothetical protein KatS3mg004_3210 [Bryobacteraceae bacterium]
MRERVPSRDRPPVRITTWKGIATHLGVSVRTAQHWVRTRGLPVHRLPGGRGGVYALAEELDAWMKQAEAEILQAQQSGRRRRLLAIGAGVAAVLLALAGIVAGFWNHLRSYWTWPALVRVENEALAAIDAQGRELWRHPLLPPSDLPGARLAHGRSEAVLADLNGDGSPEAVVVAVYESSQPGAGRESRTRLACLNARGRLLWERPPACDLRDANGVPFVQEWEVHAMTAARAAGRDHVWVALGHHTRFPGVVGELLPDGRLRMLFANHGHVNSLAAVQRDGRLWLLAGGATNALGGAFLALLDPGRGFAKAPEGGPDRYRFQTPPQAELPIYFHLPALDLTAATLSDVNHAYMFEKRPQGGVARISIGGAENCVIYLEFDYPLEPRVARITAACGLLHRQLEERGVIHHPFERCPDFQQPLRLRRWVPAAGWSDVRVPMATMKNKF